MKYYSVLQAARDNQNISALVTIKIHFKTFSQYRGKKRNSCAISACSK